MTAAPTTRPRRAADLVCGLLLTALAAAGFSYSAWAWAGLGGASGPLTAAHKQHNERRTYGHLRRIAAAQERYRQRDWDGDGNRTYAEFYVHLWRSVRVDGRPVPVELIPRELGFAMAPAFAHDGYVYSDQHSAAAGWAVVARPAAPGQTGLLPFLADSSGAIWTLIRPRSATAGGPPAAPRRIKIRSLEHLRQFQRGQDYTRGAEGRELSF